MDQNHKNKMRFLLIYSFVRYLIQRVGVTLTPGIIIVADGKNEAKQIASNLIKIGIAKRFNAEAIQEDFPDNYQMSVRVLEKRDSENEILSFLETEKFLPVVIASGICPEYVEDDIYVIRMDSDIPQTSISEFHEITIWVLDNLEVVLHEMRRLDCSLKRAEIAKKVSLLYRVIAMIASVLEMYHMDTSGDELLANSETKEFLEWGKNMLEDIAKLTGYCKISEAVAHAVYEYLNVGNKSYFVDLASADNTINSKMFPKVIFFDETWYFLQENHLKEMCSKICNDVSFRQIKEELVKEGVLEVSEWSQNNYTIQMSVHIDGQTKRKHFLKIKKDVFLSEDDEYIEDIMNRYEVDMEESDNETWCD